MAANGASTSASSVHSDAKPVVVRVKRKTSQSPLDAFWLEINERPLKRALLDFEKLSLSKSSAQEELKSTKLFLQHVETVSSAVATVDIVQSFVEPYLAEVSGSKTKSEDRRHNFKKENENIQDKILSKTRQKKEAVAKNARFEQIWRSRKGNNETADGKLQDMCHFYDVVRIDAEERANEIKHMEETLEDHRIMCNYLPLLREFIPSAAEEIESDLFANKILKDDYVYDFYTVMEVDKTTIDASSHPFPLVQVEEEDFCEGPNDSEYGSDDSNAENNPLNEYPDEEESEDEEESSDSDNDSEEESDDDRSSASEKFDLNGRSEEIFLNGEEYGDDDDDYDDTDSMYEYKNEDDNCC